MGVGVAEAPVGGVLSFPAAAALIDRPSQTLRSWVRTGLTPATYGRGEAGSDVLSFHDVVSLEIIRRLRKAGVSLQRIRVLESELRRLHPDQARPFAHRVFFTDGAAVWIELGDREGLVEVATNLRNQLAWREPIASFAQEIRYDEGGAARQWDIHKHIVVDPAVQFGSPTIRGTRITVDAVLANLEVDDAAGVADLLGISEDDVRAVIEFSGG